MTDFANTNWAKPEFTQDYRDHADVYIVERGRMFSLLRSFYTRFVKDGGRKAVLDLGCGDGIVTANLLQADPSIAATLVDGSDDMLEKARLRLGNAQAKYVRSSFQEIIAGKPLQGPFDFVASSMAIHHLTMQEKRALFEKVFALLPRGGYFMNIDAVLAPTEALEQWYLAVWKDWIVERKRALGIIGDHLDNIVQRYKELEENKPDRLSDQLMALGKAGFVEMDCYYKYGIFAIFGGRKP